MQMWENQRKGYKTLSLESIWKKNNKYQSKQETAKSKIW